MSIVVTKHKVFIFFCLNLNNCFFHIFRMLATMVKQFQDSKIKYSPIELQNATYSYTDVLRQDIGNNYNSKYFL